jgi:hypothetical protein
MPYINYAAFQSVKETFLFLRYLWKSRSKVFFYISVCLSFVVSSVEPSASSIVIIVHLRLRVSYDVLSSRMHFHCFRAYNRLAARPLHPRNSILLILCQFIPAETFTRFTKCHDQMGRVPTDTLPPRVLLSRLRSLGLCSGLLVGRCRDNTSN